MTPGPPSSTTEVRERPVGFVADDGVALAGAWFERAGGAPPPIVVVMACGAGIPARYYRRFALYLAGRGAAVLTFDYRGVGASRTGSLRTLHSGMDDWALRDIGAAFEEAHRRYPSLPMATVAHSVGTLLVGAAPGAARLSRAVFLGAHTGYWRDYRRRWRVPLFLTWHVFMPSVTRVVGYFPGRALRLGEDLPRQAALDWAARRQPALIRTAQDERRFGASMPRFREFRAATLAVSISDDAFAPPGAARTLLAMYPNLSARHETVTPASLGCRRLGHFGFLRRPAGEYFWRRAAAWLMPDPAGETSGAGTAATNRGADSDGEPAAAHRPVRGAA
jgi:predicted alpha/beta hydrolase